MKKSHVLRIFIFLSIGAIGFCSKTFAQEDLSNYYPKKIYEFEVKDLPMQDAVATLIRKSGLQIMVDQGIEKNVTLYLNNISARDILRILVDSYSLAYIEKNDMIRIVTKDTFLEEVGYSFGEKIKTKMIPLLHAKVEDIIDVLDEFKSDNGKVIFNDETSTFILIDAPDKIEDMISYIKKVDVPIETKSFTFKYIQAGQVYDRVKSMLTINVGKIKIENNILEVTDTLLKLVEIEKLIEDIDQAEKEVEIEAKIIQIVLNDEHVQGVDWEAIVSDFQKTSFLGMRHAIEGKNREISWGTVSDEDYKVLLDALDTVGDITEVSKETFVGLSQTKHKLQIRPLETISLIPEEKAYIDRNGRKEDIYFYIEPQEIQDTGIEVLIQPEVFSLNEESLTLSVKDGATIVVGGLFKEVTVETERRIPLLSDIPLIRDVPFEDIPILGFAFRNSKRRERKTEIIIFLSTKTLVSGN